MVDLADQPQTAAVPGGRLPPDLARLLSERVRRLASRPFLTVYDEWRGDRTELSYATFGNWAAKTANLLTLEFDIARGGSVAVVLGSHWAAAVTLAGCWQVGAGAVVLPPEVQTVPAGAQVAVVREDIARHLAGTGAPLLVVGTDPGARLSGQDGGWGAAGVSAGEVRGFAEEALAFGDDYDDPDVAGADPAAEVGGRPWSHAELLAAAAGRLQAGDRLLTTVGVDRAAGLVDGLVAPLLAGGSVVLVAGAEPARLRQRARQERATVALIDPADQTAAAALREEGLPLLQG